MTPLHNLGEFIRQSLLLIPLSGVRILFVGTLLAMAMWIVMLPKERTQPIGGAKRWDENLKIGALLALLIQIVVYCLF
jgi:hypothetical protein